MQRGRLEAFSDGVLAIIITIMVLEMKAPHAGDLTALTKLWPVFLSYVLSFIYVGIYWNNHHHLLHTVERINGKVLWANLHLLFWLSLIPFVTGWMGETVFATLPVGLYGVVLLMSSLAWRLLTAALIQAEGQSSTLALAVGGDRKTKLSLALYLAALPLSYYQRWLAFALYICVALIWLIPDRRIERSLAD